MKEAYKDIGYSYTLKRLSETAKTFKNLGEVYGEARQEENGFKSQLLLVADILEDCVAMNYNATVPEKAKLKQLHRKCMASGILVSNVRMVEGKRKELVLTARAIMKGCVSERVLRRCILETFGKEFFSHNENRVVVNEKEEQFVYYQEDRFRILTGMARHCKGKAKGNSNENGDNFLMSKLNCGKMVAAIADGCGSGRRAFVESRMVIELMENCIDAGFEEKTAINLINSAYISGARDNRPVTMDIGVIDCQAGVLNCIKLGAVSTFIKRDGCVEIIKSTTLPIGVLEQVDYDSTTKKLYNNDYIIMISDGVLDNLSGTDKEEQMVSIISSISAKKPKIIAEQILKASLENNDMEAFDDCTVMVLGVFDTAVNR